MIDISIDIKSNFIEKIEINGHAGSAEKGYDLICCSVSTLLISLINGLSEYVKADIEVKIEEGHSFIHIFDKDKEKRMKIEILTNVFLLSVRGLERENPKFIRLNITEE